MPTLVSVPAATEHSAPGRERADAGPPPLPARFPPTTEAALYFCCAEVIESRCRDPHAAPLAIRIRTEHGAVFLEVAFLEVDAEGAVDAGEADDRTGAGVAGVPGRLTGLDDRRVLRMRDRVEALGGTLHVDGGTLLVGDLPATAHVLPHP